MDLQLPVLRVLLAHPSGTTRKCIAEELNAALGDEVEADAPGFPPLNGPPRE